MRMVFDTDEVEAIIKRHVAEKLGVTVDSIQDIAFLDTENERADLYSVSVEVTTEGGIPQWGPYRTQGR